MRDVKRKGKFYYIEQMMLSIAANKQKCQKSCIQKGAFAYFPTVKK
tara:strand:+ start:1176 stop:1313 length:138 start_codon:yes stop_codon:yes gene_type:complete